MQVLERFSESEKNYLLYEQRLEAERLEVMWQRLRAEADRSRADVERSHAEADRLRAEAEHERRDKERLLALLRKAGIDPDKETTDDE